jgi:hypothetical protein
MVLTRVAVVFRGEEGVRAGDGGGALPLIFTAGVTVLSFFAIQMHSVLNMCVD